MMQPMAIVTIGGLIYGTLLTLLVVPCIYGLFNRRKRKQSKSYKTIKYDRFPLLLKEKRYNSTRIMSELT